MISIYLLGQGKPVLLDGLDRFTRASCYSKDYSKICLVWGLPDLNKTSTQIISVCAGTYIFHPTPPPGKNMTKGKRKGEQVKRGKGERKSIRGTITPKSCT